MATWTDEDLDRIGNAEELQLTSLRVDKYDRYGSMIVGHVTGPEAQPVTIRLIPKERADGHQ